MTLSLASVSGSISTLVAAASPLLVAIRVGPNRHVSGLLCPGGGIVTTDQALPALDTYTVVLANRAAQPARPGPRDASANLATVQLDFATPVDFPPISLATLGGLVVVLGTEADASPTVRLSVIHRLVRTLEGPVGILDLSGDSFQPGSPVLDGDGALIGFTALGPNNEVIAIPAAPIGRTLEHDTGEAPYVAEPAEPQRARSPRGGWLGVALQPINVPDKLAVRVGQPSGRRVVSMNRGGPAERSGMRVGDIVLSLNGTSASGPHALRAFLAGDVVGDTVEIRLLREGNLVTVFPVVAPQP